MKQGRLPGGRLEYAVLTRLWELGAASARQLHASVGEPAGLVYTTTAKVLDRLHEKGLVRRAKSGKAFIYRAAVPRRRVERVRARNLLTQLLGAHPHAAMAGLVDAVEALDPELLAELERAVKARRGRSAHGT